MEAMNEIAVRNELLGLMYQLNDCPVDQLLNDRGAMEVFTDNYNTVAMTEMTPGEVGQQLVKLRKMGLLPKLGRQYTGPRYR